MLRATDELTLFKKNSYASRNKNNFCRKCDTFLTRLYGIKTFKY